MELYHSFRTKDSNFICDKIDIMQSDSLYSVYNPSYSPGYGGSYYSLWSFDKNIGVKYIQAPLSMPSTTHPQKAKQWFYYNTPIWPIIIIVLIVYLVWTEYGSQDCREQNCNNRAKIIHSTDTRGTAIDKISSNVLKNHAVIGWRRTLIVAIIIAIIVLLIFCKEFPHGFTVTIAILIIFLLAYFSSAWLQAHWWKFNDYKIERSLKDLRKHYKDE